MEGNKYYENLKIMTYPSGLLHDFGVNGKVSGSIFATGEISGAVAVVHGAIGCGYHYRYSARTRHYPNFKVVSSDLTEHDVIFGGEEKLLQAIIQADKTFHPKLVIVISTPTADIIRDDMEAVCHRAHAEYGIPTILAKSELFSHRDKSYTKKRLKELSKQKMNDSKNIDMDIKGCGYSEALYALVEQVMEPQEVVPNTVNIETIAWGVEGKEVLKEMEMTLNDMGIIVNSFIPTASIEQLKTLPRGALNLVKRLHWADRMKEVFGTPVLQLGGNGRYTGLDGVVVFYRDVLAILGIEDKDEYLESCYQKALSETKEEREKMSEKKVYVISSQISTLPYLLKRYKEAYNINVVGVGIFVTEHTIQSSDITKEVMDNLLSRVNDSLDLYYPGVKARFNCSWDELQDTCKKADVIMGTSNYAYERLGLPLISPSLDGTSYSFESYVRSVKEIYRALSSVNNHGNLILNMMDFDFEYYPLLKDDGVYATRDLWHKMWLDR